jgi:hypothetical protein
MLKRLTLLVMAAAALAVPAVAQATTLQSPTGTVLKAGAKVRAISTNMQSRNVAYETRCNVTIEGEVTTFGGPGKVAKITPYAAPKGMVWSKCSAGGEERNVTIDESTAGVISIGGSSPGIGGFSAGFRESDGGYYTNCQMSGIFGFTYSSGASSFAIPGSLFQAAPNIGTCPLPEQTWSGTFALETSTGSAVTIVD